MGHEIHITKGPGFGAAGGDPITDAQWTEVVGTHDAIEVRKPGSRFGRLGGRPLVFNAGLIAATSPDEAAMAMLQTIARSLEARLFGEDGTEYGLGVLGAVRSRLRTAFPRLDTSPLAEDAAASLQRVADGDPTGDRAVLEQAVDACAALEGAAAEIGLSYLIVRAVEAGGQPPASSTSVAAALVPRAPKRLDTFRRAPTEAWVAEVEALAKLMASRPGHYVVRKCPQCGAKNRVVLFAPQGRRATCGKCKTALGEAI